MREYKTYFAASNSYTGFVSHFDKIFSPIVLNKLYILKGGPGTGKSTIMKEISNRFAKECDVTNILCSSDPESFDGVLLECNGVTVGIVDGTAPHVVEPIYPGAVEEIINLGDAFDFEALQSEKERIVKLSQMKKQAYLRAYSALFQAGSIHDYIISSFVDIGVNSRAECLIEEKINLKECEDFYMKVSDSITTYSEIPSPPTVKTCFLFSFFDNLRSPFLQKADIL